MLVRNIFKGHIGQQCPNILLQRLVTKQHPHASPAPSYTTAAAKEELTPLAKHIRDIILATGPISVAKYMQLALTSPIGGYYTKGQIFGKEGDFITSPEISQMFGEVLAVWYVLHWELMGQPPKTVFVELGPGRGTLMDDMLRAAKRFKEFFATIQSIHLVERSPELRRLQHDKLGCDPQTTKNVNDKNDNGTPVESVSKARGSLPVKWYDLLEEIDVDIDCVPLVMAHEFFDALPIYKFEKSNAGVWSEILVDVADSDSEPMDMRTTAKPSNTQHKSIFDGTESCNFKFVKARNVTSNAAMIMRNEAFNSRFDKGDHVEVSPESARVMAQLADWISTRNGMGLIMDYGQDWTQGDTFRGVRSHKFANPLSMPGSMDLTADVDFSYLRYAASNKAQCHGPIEQGKFLHAMGIQARLQHLLQATTDTKVQKDLVDCYRRLTDPHSMGRIYKVLAVMPTDIKKAPIPFALPSKEELNKPKIEKITR
ncbi:hypothetical protein GGI25_001583 [Coemansia spiralis]|uniref:Protein arginine methyltransferase NDUFAF7 n=2 Tax=Coemansia TaxID=4863 RepID=A0A9W8L008_9FUNG|nr:hypothetical protein EDC05_002085 [Coemansia umbellata]KAJ2622941.1 hypothetical protein GGI26_002742 [Coemansia sp. RSA 1358]KAJ2679448.1 hypothetical protein GGI25_001583 [Coemansia spiralis]